MNQHLRHGIGIFICLVIFFALIFMLEPMLLGFVVTAVDNQHNIVPIEWWVPRFQFENYYMLGLSLLGMLIWYVKGAFFTSFSENRWDGIKFFWWFLFIVISAISIYTSIMFLLKHPTSSGEWLVSLLFCLNTLGFYYLATVYFSPYTVKYYPPGAMKLRKYW